MFKNKQFLLKAFFILMALESMIICFHLASIPRDVKNAVFLGFSISRLVLIGAPFVLFLTASYLLGWIHFSQPALDRMITHLESFISDSKRRRVFLVVCGLTLTAGGLFLLTPAERVGEAVYQRIAPLMVLGAMLAVQGLLFLVRWMERKIYWKQLLQWKPLMTPAGIAIAIFALLWIGIAFSGIGVRPEQSGWFPPGTPILAQQVLGAWLIGLVFILFAQKLGRSRFSNNLDTIVGIGLWLIAGLFWWMEPLQRWSYFTQEPTPPNFEYYPYSDAALYDGFAQNLLIGTSRQIGLTNRPLYSLFLALLHALVGQKFESVVFLQVFILAIMVVLIYRIATHLGGRPAGVIAALLAIFRERNSIVLTNIIEVSHVKLLMSDVPTMTMMLLFMYFFVKWLNDRDGRYYLGALAGAFFGFTILIRSQVQLLLPIALVGIMLSKQAGWRSILRNSLVFLIGTLVVVAPWVWRNYQVSGRAVVEYQEFYTRIIASSYSSLPNDVDMIVGESVEQYRARMRHLIIDFIIRNPQEVARFYSSYFFHNEISSVIYLPMSFQFQNIYAYVKGMGFWFAPLAALPRDILLNFFLSFAAIALGIGTAFARTRWVGLMPLLFHFGYSFSVAPVRMSGWRYILPVDWVSYLYFSIGLAQITIIVLGLFSGKPEPQIMDEESHAPSMVRPRTVFTLMALAAIGLSFPLLEVGIPQRYPALDPADLVQRYAADGLQLENGELVNASAMKTFLETEAGATALYGRALYPAYYPQGKFWGDDTPNLIEASQYDHVQFFLIGSIGAFIYLPLQEAPLYFPHASDVFIVGCNQESSVRALFVKVNDDLLVSSPFRGLNCSPLE